MSSPDNFIPNGKCQIPIHFYFSSWKCSKWYIISSYEAQKDTGDRKFSLCQNPWGYTKRKDLGARRSGVAMQAAAFIPPASEVTPMFRALELLPCKWFSKHSLS